MKAERWSGGRPRPPKRSGTARADPGARGRAPLHQSALRQEFSTHAARSRPHEMSSSFETEVAALNRPWIESPYFPDLLKRAGLTPEMEQLVRTLARGGHG